MTSARDTVDLSFGLDGKVAVVTGGASGIGAAIAEAYAAKGASVAILDLTEDAAQSQAAAIGTGARAFACDVTDATSVHRTVDAVVAANPDKVEQAKAKPSLAGWFVGQVMKATGGKANPQAVNQILKAKLGIE